MAQVRSFTVNNAPYNNLDSEGLAFGNGVLYMVDAIDNDLVKVQPGNNGVVGNSDDQVTNYDLETFGQREPEGLDVHPATGNIWVVSNRVSQSLGPDPMIEVTPDGALVSSVSIAEANPNSAAGLAIAPPSAGGSGYNIYIADRGVDNNDVPSENDGKIYEFSLGPSGPVAPVAEFTWSQSPGTTTVQFTDTSTGSPTSWSWDFGNGGGTIDSTEQNPSFTFAAPGTYTVTLTAANAQGPDSQTHAVTVTDPNAPPNLLLNPSFELDANGNNIPDDWGTQAKFTRSNAIPAQDGAFVGRHLNNNAVVYQQVNVTVGTSYDFSGMVNLPTTSDAFSFALNVQWRGAGGNLGAPVVIHTFTDDTTGSWQTRTATLVAPAGVTAARIQMDGDSMNATGIAYVDAFSFGTGGAAPLDTTITAGPSGSTSATDATFTFTGTPSGVTFECKLDSPTWVACTSPQSYPGPLSQGSHTFEVRAVDGGTPDPTPAQRTWTIVPPPPLDTTITGGPSGDVTATDATFTFTGTPSGVTFECQLDGAAFAACTSPKNYPGPLPQGSHTFQVRAVDGGTPDPTPAQRMWNIVAGSTNLLTNPGFELDANLDTIPDNWGTSTKFTRSSAITPHGGTFVGRHFQTTDGSYAIFQEVPATAGTQYTLTAWVNIPAPADPSFVFNLRLRWVNGTTVLSTNSLTTINAATSGWQQFTLSATAPTSTTGVRVTMAPDTLNGTIYVDDFSLVAGP